MGARLSRGPDSPALHLNPNFLMLLRHRLNICLKKITFSKVSVAVFRDCHHFSTQAGRGYFPDPLAT
jgi:hypothetical protein